MMLLQLFSSVFVSLPLVVAAVAAAPDDEVSAASPTSAPLTETFPPTAVVDPYVLRAVGEGGVDSPHGTDGITLDQLTIVTFFEAHQSHFETGINKALTIEVYANVPEGQDCMTGTLLESVEGEEFTLTTEATQYDKYNTDFPGSTDFPVTSEGKVGAATVTISDFQYTPTDDMNKKIWFPGRGDKDGQIEVCIMVALTIEDDTNNGRDNQEYYVSHMDSKRTINIDLMAKMEAVIQVVPVDTFLCNNKHEPVRQEKRYTSGQNFRICVGPTEEGVHNGYKVDNYLELICDGRPLVIPEVVDDEDIGPTIESVYKNNKLAIRSALTAKDGMDGKARITCTGIVSLSYTAPPTAVRTLRGLQPITGIVPSGGAAADDLLEGLFEVTIEMDTPTNESSSAPFSSSMTTTVAVIGFFGSLLSIISSMI